MVAQDDRVIVQRLIKERQTCIDNSVKAMRSNNRFLAQVLAGLGGYLESILTGEINTSNFKTMIEQIEVMTDSRVKNS